MNHDIQSLEADGLADDLLHGREEIAHFIGVSLRRATYLLESEQIPAGKLGSR